jgi:3',5'-nucleoside bisphosphate phosphatase
MIDLHTHSTFSDGTEPPAALARLGRRLGLTALALTDHDTMAGVPAFLDACRAEGIVGISGVEISAEVDVAEHGGGSTLHILGYGVDPRNPQVCELLGRVLDGRAWRNGEILARLDGLGLRLERDAVAACAGEDVVGRPHIARAMIDRGYVATAQEAFDRYLAKGAPAYVDRYRLRPDEAITMIRAAGGLPFFAHPFTWIAEERRLETELAALRERGLAGIEVWHSDHTGEQVVALLRMALRLGLMISGGSDYHGAAKPLIRLGTGRGNLDVAGKYAESLIDALGRGNPNICVP